MNVLSTFFLLLTEIQDVISDSVWAVNGQRIYLAFQNEITLKMKTQMSNRLHNLSELCP